MFPFLNFTHSVFNNQSRGCCFKLSFLSQLSDSEEALPVFYHQIFKGLGQCN